MKVAVTGANGFVGRAVIANLLAHGHQVRALTRAPDVGMIMPGVEGIATGAVEAIEDWRPFLDGCQGVVHLAARAHVPDAIFANEDVVRAINTDATLALAESAARRGVRRFVFVSSVKVHGDSTPWDGREGKPLRETDAIDPADAYARSKAEAEAGLRAIEARTSLPVTILRPPLVHGAGARANLAALFALVARAPVLPFGGIDNRRSLISVDNLASAIRLCLDHQAAPGRAFLVSDGEDPSTPELVRLIAEAMGRKVWQPAVPLVALKAIFGFAGRADALRRLTGSLQVDPSKIVLELGWRPVETLEQGLAKAVKAWVARRPA